MLPIPIKCLCIFVLLVSFYVDVQGTDSEDVSDVKSNPELSKVTTVAQDLSGQLENIKGHKEHIPVEMEEITTARPRKHKRKHNRERKTHRRRGNNKRKGHRRKNTNRGQSSEVDESRDHDNSGEQLPSKKILRRRSHHRRHATQPSSQ